ncbi:CdaR family transcriptional regulator [Pseudomonas sp. J237]|nr:MULTISPECIES: sugar diacid recognition domain-containing protein [Pseudomonas]OEO26543.1 CdaR family transcriptional regulator [Pseudomonas sp. J237]
MLELDLPLAQHIVDRAMAIVPYNINVMDAQGMIIGSGDPQRLHTRHEGAQLVLANRRMVEVDEQAAACLRGVRPGVNVPLVQGDQLIGVLGITGEPAIVRPYAELLRMAAEMLVEQRQLHAERDWQRHQLEAWLRHLFDPQVSLPSLQVEADRLQLSLRWPSQVCVLELNATHQVAAGQARILTALRSISDCLCAPLSATEVLWCRPYSARRDDRAWLAQADEREWGVARLLVSDPVSNLDELRQASQALQALKAFSAEQLPGQRLLELSEHRLATLLHSQRNSWLLKGWLQPLQQLQAQDRTGVLMTTLSVWCRHDGQAQVCAQALGVHRNTLRYRLERIAELSGIELARFDQRLQLSLGLGLLTPQG